MTAPQLDLAFARRHDRTVIERRLFRWPFALTRTFALDSAPAHMLTVIVQTSSGAVHGEDRLGQRLLVRADAAAHVTTQGASAIHRADPGLTTSERVDIDVETGGYFEFLPEPRILFPGAALEQNLRINCAVGGVVLVGDGFTVYDAEGANQSFRRYVSTTELRIGGGRSVMIDRMDISGLGASPRTGFTAFGSLTLAAPGRADLGAGLAEALTAAFSDVAGLYAAASPLPGEATGLGVRLAGRDLRAVRAGAALAWRLIRTVLHGASPPSRRKGYDLAAEHR